METDDIYFLKFYLKRKIKNSLHFFVDNTLKLKKIDLSVGEGSVHEVILKQSGLF